MKKFLFFIIIYLINSSSLKAQIIPNGTIDNIEELTKKETIYIPMDDGTLLATDLYIPIVRDSVVAQISLGNQSYTVQFIPKNTQYIIYDTSNIQADNFSLPLILSRTPYNKEGASKQGNIFPFFGYIFANQDMRGRYSSEGVYFPMYSDSWPKTSYHPNIGIPMDLYSLNHPKNALKHHDGSQTINYLSNNAKRIEDVNNDGIIDTISLTNGNIGMFGASAMGNSQYQALSDLPFAQSNALKCIMPIVATNEHYNTTLFNNGVFRNSLVRGWITGQLTDVKPSLDSIDNSLENNIHSTSDYGYTDSLELSKDLINWFVSDKHSTSPSGAYPNSILRSDLDASQAPINAQGNSDKNGQLSRYKNLNKPGYHITGWWDIFINGQIETYNRIKASNPGVRQKLVIGPWAHQTIGANKTGMVTYPQNVYDILNIDLDLDSNLFSSDIIKRIYESEIINWYKTHMGGEPFFIIPESNTLQNIGTGQIRIPAKNYIIPHYQFLNYLGGVTQLPQIPIEIIVNNVVTPMSIDFPALGTNLFNLSSPLSPSNLNQINQTKDVRIYVTGPLNDPQNPQTGNYWLGLDAFPLEQGISKEKFYLHKNKSITTQIPTNFEGELQYTADPHNPVLTIGGNNMIPSLPDGSGNSQGQIDLAHSNWKTLTLERNDILSFQTEVFSDTFSIIGFPKASIYAKGHTNTYNTSKTDFDLMVRIVDVFPDGRELFVSEGTVNAKARAYAKALLQGIDSTEISYDNINNNVFYNFEFQLLPIAYTFGKGHRIKVLISSSNYPKYQSNPHLPNEDGEFFRWNPGDTNSYTYQGQTLQPQSSEITFSFNNIYPTFIEFPKLDTIFPTGIYQTRADSKIFEIYPNPTSKEVNITWTEAVESNIIIRDLSGKTVFKNKISKAENRKTLSIGSLTAGMYFIEIEAWNITKKLIVK
ncbi:MAG TPA: CocE/NonD family hydrolase [Edaphocola sp.]|nr:CocE/NonD family hydrolase [Edaphocola sp.]